ncbi:oxidoreductase domain-containing protein [Aspergillus ellipticus CBS 707.79]|uniref:Oxidoreductase domain-containing protein n=1 Tax=Aspergillus ellipticus CBS 707.79 TaxID=1448320 RepID=A0A319DI88_9EURO|nr:oxidoreductase domain-containing protein [Aspergillus ellipticus CBS 707.79]
MAEPAKGFLTAPPPPNAHCQRIDFEHTKPAFPEYKNLCAAVIDDVFAPEECNELLRLAESSTLPQRSGGGGGGGGGDPAAPPVWERAMINIGNGKQLGIDHLDNQPLVTGLAGRNKSYRLTRLNERLRFLKYEGGEYFRPHWDGFYTTPDKTEKSYFTVHLYLNGAGEQDHNEWKKAMKKVGTSGEKNLDTNGELLGGATSFLEGFNEKGRTLRVFPRTGSVLVFQQNDLMHAGDPVLRGTKYTVRTDIMYQRV